MRFLVPLFTRGLLLVTLAIAGCTRPGDPIEATKKFFGQISSGQAAAAYADASYGFKLQQTEAAFVQRVKEQGLLDHTALQWEPPTLADGEAKVRVSITTRDRQQLPFIVTLVSESGAWRVYSLRSPKGEPGRFENRFTLVGKGAGFSDMQSHPVPDDAEIRQLVLRALRNFDDAVQQKSFAEFYDHVSVAWQKQLTLGQLERAFKPFIESSVRLGGLREAEMQLDGPPSINSEGILAVNGHFPTSPYQIYFSLKFVYELPRWQLFGIDVNLQR